MSFEKPPFYLYLNYVCNQHCVFCASPHTNGGESIREIPWKILERELQEECLENAPVILSGGEPTCYGELWHLLDHLSTHTRFIDVMTNGLLLAEDHFASKLLGYPIACLSIPIYGFEETHDRLVGHRSHQTLLAALERINAAPVEMNLKLLITRQNYAELPELLRFLVNRYGSRPHYTLNTLIYGDNARQSDSWIRLCEVRSVVSEMLSYGFGHDLKLSLSFVPACALTSEFLSARLLEFFALSRSKHTQQPGSTVRIITPSKLRFETVREDVYIPSVCEACGVREFCLRVHLTAEDAGERELGLQPIQLIGGKACFVGEIRPAD